MKKTLIALACGLALTLSAGTAQALTIGDADPRYLGEIDPATPSNPTNEVSYINQLISMAPNATTTISGNEFDRSDNQCGGAGGGSTIDACPQAVLAGADADNSPDDTIDVTGWTWLYVKYGGDAHVWYVGDLSGIQSVPLNNLGGQGQSHYALYNPGGTSVPDGGATLGLLGLGMMGLGYLRRRKQ